MLNKKLDEDNPDAAAIALELRGNIEEFRKHLPLIKYLSSEAILDEDWKEIKEAVGLDNFDRNEELQLQKMIDENIG